MFDDLLVVKNKVYIMVEMDKISNREKIINKLI